MLIVSLLMLFACVCMLAGCLLFPVWRAVFAQSVRRAGRHVGALAQVRWARALQGAATAGRGVRGSGGAAAHLLRQHWLAALAAAVLVTVPALLAALLSGRTMLDGYADHQRLSNAQIAQLLQGEQLAAPAPLPPLTFTTAEVQLLRPMLGSANRNWQLLDPAFAQRLLVVFRIMKERHGYDMAILEGYRSPERQDALAAAGSHVTSAKAFQSYHQFGMAADCAFVRNGKLLISERDPWAMRGYQLYGQVAESVGLHWGGRWKMLDYGHTELRSRQPAGG